MHTTPLKYYKTMIFIVATLGFTYFSTMKYYIIVLSLYLQIINSNFITGTAAAL